MQREGRCCRRNTREQMDCPNRDDDANDCPAVPLAITTIGMQRWNCLYEPKQGLAEGTMFPELNLPYNSGGRR